MPRYLSTSIHLETLAAVGPVPDVLVTFGLAAAGFFGGGWVAWQVARPLIARWERRQWATTKKEIQHLRNMTWQQFEVYAGAFFERRGWSVQFTGGGGADDGIDLRLSRPGGLRVIVSCKHYRGKAGVSIVREAYAVARKSKARGAYVVALGGFTKAAREWVQGMPVKLIDGEMLITMMNR